MLAVSSVPAIQQLLDSARIRLAAAGVDDPSLTSLLLLEHVCGLTRDQLLAHSDHLVLANIAASFEQAVERRRQREPLAHILGWREFFGRHFAVNSGTLIPRPETEGVVERALRWLEHYQSPSTTALSALDVGTGSGAIAISLLAEVPSLRVIATDKSLAALQVAHANARAHGVEDRLRLVACDLASGLGGPFRVVVANLPYIPSAEIAYLQPEIAFEPREALDGGPDGTSAIKRLLRQLPVLLTTGGLAIVEIGYDQGPTLLNVATAELPGCHGSVERDPGGCDRYLLVQRQREEETSSLYVEEPLDQGPPGMTNLRLALRSG